MSCKVRAADVGDDPPDIANPVRRSRLHASPLLPSPCLHYLLYRTCVGVGAPRRTGQASSLLSLALQHRHQPRTCCPVCRLQLTLPTLRGSHVSHSASPSSRSQLPSRPPCLYTLPCPGCSSLRCLPLSSQGALTAPSCDESLLWAQLYGARVFKLQSNFTKFQTQAASTDHNLGLVNQAQHSHNTTFTFSRPVFRTASQGGDCVLEKATDRQQLLAWRQMPMEAMACLAQAAPHIDLRKEPKVLCWSSGGASMWHVHQSLQLTLILNHVLPPKPCGAASPSGLIAAHHQAVAGCTLDEHGKDKPQLQVRIRVTPVGFCSWLLTRRTPLAPPPPMLLETVLL